MLTWHVFLSEYSGLQARRYSLRQLPADALQGSSKMQKARKLTGLFLILQQLFVEGTLPCVMNVLLGIFAFILA